MPNLSLQEVHDIGDLPKKVVLVGKITASLEGGKFVMADTTSTIIVATGDCQTSSFTKHIVHPNFVRIVNPHITQDRSSIILDGNSAVFLMPPFEGVVEDQSPPGANHSGPCLTDTNVLGPRQVICKQFFLMKNPTQCYFWPILVQ
jgi:hypothetical protein